MPSDGAPAGAPRRVALIGLPGSGKSSLGAELARRLRYRFVDTDAEIEAAAGRRIADLVDDAGWPAFREREARIVAAALERDDVVIATGGGAVETPAVAAALADRAVCAWLLAPLDLLERRLAAEPRHARPLLASGSGTALATLSERRAPLYAALARVVLPVAGWSPAAGAAELERLLVAVPVRP